MKISMERIKKGVLPALLCTLALSSGAVLTSQYNVHAKSNEAPRITNQKTNQANNLNQNHQNTKMINHLHQAQKAGTRQPLRQPSSSSEIEWLNPIHHSHHQRNKQIKNNQTNPVNQFNKQNKQKINSKIKNIHHIKHHIRHHHVHIHLHHIKKHKHTRKATMLAQPLKQANQQNSNSNVIKNLPQQKIDHNYRHAKWFKDGLSHRELKARNWIVTRESGHHWHILSYGHVCIGYFQLSPALLGRKHGHINLDRRHQVKVADNYVRNRYHNWLGAKAWWEGHHWY